MSLQSLCAELAEVVGRPGSGIAVSRNEPPETIGTFPTSWVNPVSGEVRRTSGDAMWIHSLELIVYVGPRVANLPAEFSRIAPLVSSVERAVWEAYQAGDAFGPSVSRCVVVGYRIGLRQFAGKEFHSITFQIDAKEHTE